MKKYFIVSLIKSGVLGGGIIADSEKITYKTNKLTVSEEIKNIEMPYREIKEINYKNRLIFGIFKISLKNNKEYKFLVFSKKHFKKLIEENSEAPIFII